MSGVLKRAVNFCKLEEVKGAISAAILGGAVFFIFFGEIFWPQNLSWILSDGGDSFNHQIGWEFFRHSSWSWPWGMVKNLNYPFGISVLYTDSLPLLALFFKLWRAWLPVEFQYTGLWIFLCFALQGVLGFFLTRLIRKDVWFNILASLLFIFNPIIFQRVAGHASLVGHFVILGALWLCLKRSSRQHFGFWLCLMSVALFTNPYLFFMVAPWWAIDRLRLYQQTPKVNWWRNNFLIFIWLALGSWAIGMWGEGTGGAEGWGQFSMNLNALFNPLGWSKITPEWPIAFYQYEGFNYLGLGVIFLLIGSLSFLFFRRHDLLVVYFKKFWPVLLVAFLLTVLALSNKIYLNSHLLFSYPLPVRLEKMLSIVRSSGRLFWPVYYLLVVLALWPLRFLKRRAAIIILLLVLILQAADLSKGIFNQHLAYSNNVWQYESKTSFWNSYSYWNYLLASYEHVVYLPDFPHYDMPVALLLAQSGRTLNAGEFTREQKGTKEYLQEQIKNVCAGNFEKNTAYIFYNDLYKCLPLPETTPQKYLLKKAFNFHVLLPK